MTEQYDMTPASDGEYPAERYAAGWVNPDSGPAGQSGAVPAGVYLPYPSRIKPTGLGYRVKWIEVEDELDYVETGTYEYLEPSGPAAPAFASGPTITGAALVGSTLTCAYAATGNPTATPSYQWKRGSTNVGTNANTYTVAGGDVGHPLTCVVTLSNTEGTDEATSNALTPSVPLNTLAPAITPSTCDAGDTLTCAPGTWTGAGITYAYQWKRDGVNISGATANTYPTVDPTDVGAVISCIVIPTNANGTGAPAASSNTVTPAEPGGVVVQVGNTDVRLSSHNFGFSDGWGLKKVTLDAGSVLRFFAYLDGLNDSQSGGIAQNVKMALYDDDGTGNLPGTRLAVSGAEAIAVGQAAGWVQFDLATPRVVTAGDYWVCIGFDDSNRVARGYFTAGASGDCCYSNVGSGYPALNNPFADPQAFNRAFSAYLEMEV